MAKEEANRDKQLVTTGLGVRIVGNSETMRLLAHCSTFANLVPNCFCKVLLLSLHNTARPAAASQKIPTTQTRSFAPPLRVFVARQRE
jgi:hypothetical protein